jgi:hypothetical protein
VELIADGRPPDWQDHRTQKLKQDERDERQRERQQQVEHRHIDADHDEVAIQEDEEGADKNQFREIIGQADHGDVQDFAQAARLGPAALDFRQGLHESPVVAYLPVGPGRFVRDPVE